MKKYLNYILLGIIIVILIISYIKMNALETEIYNLSGEVGSLNNIVSTMTNRVMNFYSTLEKEREDKNSIFEKIDLMTANMNPKTLEYDLTYKIVLKTNTKGDEVFLVFDDSRVKMTKEDVFYTASIRASALKEYHPMVLILNQDKEMIEADEKLYMEDQVFKMLPQFIVQPNGNLNFYRKILHSDYDIMLHNLSEDNGFGKDEEENFNSEFKSIKHIVMVNGNIIQEDELAATEDMNHIWEDFKYEMEFNVEDHIKIYIKAETKHGYIYSSKIADFTLKTDQNIMHNLDSHPMIYIEDENGNEVFNYE